MSRRSYNMAATTSAVSWEVFERDEFNLSRLDITFDLAPTTAGNVTITKDSVYGAAYDVVLASESPVGVTSLSFGPFVGMTRGDKLVVEYTNADARSVVASATTECLYIADLISAGLSASSGVIRSATNSYYHFFAMNLASANPGASGATYRLPTADHLGGQELDAVGDTLVGCFPLQGDYQVGTNPVLLACVTNMVDNTTGDPADVIEFEFNLWYKRDGDTACRTQSFNASVTVGQMEQYYQLHLHKEVDQGTAPNDLKVGDIVYYSVNLTAGSDISEVMINGAGVYYPINRLGVETGDV